MNDLTALLLWFVGAGLLGVAWFAYAHALDHRVHVHLRNLWQRFRAYASESPYAPRAVLLRSRDGSITLARLANGQLRSLKRKPRGKALRKQVKRLRRAQHINAATLETLRHSALSSQL
jgi:hypothetical protein